MIALWRNDREAAKAITLRHYAQAAGFAIAAPPVVAAALLPLELLLQLVIGGGATYLGAVLLVAFLSFTLSWAGVLPGVCLMALLQRIGWGGLLPVLALAVCLVPVTSCLVGGRTCSLPALLPWPPNGLSWPAIGFAALAWGYLVWRVPNGLVPPQETS